jgi:hypothetical protein
MGMGTDRTRTDLVVNGLVHQALVERELELWGPDAIKPVIHVRDAAELVEESVLMNDTSLLNICYANHRLKDIAKTISDMVPCQVRINPTKNSSSIYLDNQRMVARIKPRTFRDVDNVVTEFRRYRESPKDTTVPWNIL